MISFVFLPQHMGILNNEFIKKLIYYCWKDSIYKLLSNTNLITN